MTWCTTEIGQVVTGARSPPGVGQNTTVTSGQGQPEQAPGAPDTGMEMPEGQCESPEEVRLLSATERQFVLQTGPGIIRRDCSKHRSGCPLRNRTPGHWSFLRRGSSQTGRCSWANHRRTSEVTQPNRDRQNKWTAVVDHSSRQLPDSLISCHW